MLRSLELNRASARPKSPAPLTRTAAAMLAAALSLGAAFQASGTTTTQADTLTDSYNTAFFVVNGSNGYYAKDSTRTTAPGAVSWTQAEEIEMLLDAYDRSKSSAYLTKITQMINNFVAVSGSLWTSDIYNDDILWMTLACERAYQATGNSTFLNLAKSNFDAVYSRGWDTTLGGGIWETTLKKSKTSAANGPATISACNLYTILNDSSYLTKAKAIYAWERATIYDPSLGKIYDNIGADGTLNKVSLTYNQGTFLGAANALYGITGTASYLSDAQLMASYAQNTICTNNILPQYSTTGDFGGFNGIFIRHMAKFAQQRGLWDNYYEWLEQNAELAWSSRRSSDGLSWNDWSTATPTGTLQSWACSDSIVIANVIPPLFEPDQSTIPSYSGPDYRIIADANFRDGQGVILDSTATGNYINFLIPNVSARKYDIRVAVKKLNTRGIFQLAIGQAGNNSPNNVGTPQDLYSSTSQYVELDLGTWQPATTGDKWFWFTITGKNAASTGYSECFDYIKLIPQ